MTDMGQYDARKTVKRGDNDSVQKRHNERMQKLNAENDMIDAAKVMRETEAARVAGKLKPVQAGEKRTAALIRAVMALATYMGVTLKPIYALNAYGELSIASQGANAWDIAGVPFSPAFCRALNTHCKPRCGAPGTVAIMDPNHGNWCHINHFDAERMVYAVADSLTEKKV